MYYCSGYDGCCGNGGAAGMSADGSGCSVGGDADGVKCSRNGRNWSYCGMYYNWSVAGYVVPDLVCMTV